MQVAIATLPDIAGTSLGESAWVCIDQGRIDRFAATTLDDQWIHVDRARAAEGPFGTTIAHGYLTLSLVSKFLLELLVVPDAASVINYGLDRVRFLAPVPSGSRIRGQVTVTEVEARGRAFQVKCRVTIECDATEGPAAVADVLMRFVPA